VLVAVLIWGSTHVVPKGGVDDAPPMFFALMPHCVASAILIAVVLSRPGSAKLPRATPRGTLFLRGVTGIALYYTRFNLALTYTTASQGALVQSSTRAVMAVMAVVWLREEPATRGASVLPGAQRQTSYCASPVGTRFSGKPRHRRRGTPASTPGFPLRTDNLSWLVNPLSEWGSGGRGFKSRRPD
jgi:uncharacterized membrane protein